MSQGTKDIESLPKPYSVSAHRQCYATANYFYSAPTKLRKGKEKRQRKEKAEGVCDNIDREEERWPERWTSKTEVSRNKKEIINGDEGQSVDKEKEQRKKQRGGTQRIKSGGQKKWEW